MGPKAEEEYLYTFFNVGAGRFWLSMPRPGRFTSKKENRYLLHWRLDGPLGRRDVRLLFL